METVNTILFSISKVWAQPPMALSRVNFLHIFALLCQIPALVLLLMIMMRCYFGRLKPALQNNEYIVGP